jgi:hypothetical protein
VPETDSIAVAPCSWPLPEGFDCQELDYHPLFDEIVDAATAYLWNWTGKTFGLCDVTVRPCRRDCPEARTTYAGGSGVPHAAFGGRTAFVPVLVAGEWHNVG